MPAVNASEARLSRIRIVLCQTSHPGNIGAAARALKTMGLSQLVLVAPRQFPDREADARASGAIDVLAGARVCATLDDALAGCVLAIGLSTRHRELVGSVWSARQAAGEAIAHAALGDVALVFGTETFGLTNDELSRCQALAFIPANPEYGSLNLAAAVQVLAYEARMAAGLVGGYAAITYQPALQEEIAGLHRHAARTMEALGFFDPARPRRLLPRLRRLFARTRLEHEEVHILRGILASVDKALQQARRDER
ncbi:MAG: RNA methyltransferase [Betaproteobacteria bacterium]